MWRKRREWFAANSNLIGFAVLIAVLAICVLWLSGCSSNTETAEGKVTCYTTNWSSDGRKADLEFCNTTDATVTVAWEVYDPYFEEIWNGSGDIPPGCVKLLDGYRYDTRDTIGCTAYLPSSEGTVTLFVDEPSSDAIGERTPPPEPFDEESTDRDSETALCTDCHEYFREYVSPMMLVLAQR